MFFHKLTRLSSVTWCTSSTNVPKYSLWIQLLKVISLEITVSCTKSSYFLPKLATLLWRQMDLEDPIKFITKMSLYSRGNGQSFESFQIRQVLANGSTTKVLQWKWCGRTALELHFGSCCSWWNYRVQGFSNKSFSSHPEWLIVLEERQISMPCIQMDSNYWSLVKSWGIIVSFSIMMEIANIG